MSEDIQNSGPDLENPSTGLDLENPNISRSDPRRKWVILMLSTLLIAVIAISVSLGVILPRNNQVAIASNPALSEGAMDSNDVGGLTDENNDSSTNPNSSSSTTDLLNTTSVTTSSGQSISTAQFIESNGPLDAKVRMIDPSAVQSYDSCDALEDDIINALKHYANTIIENEKINDWWAKCDFDDPTWNPWGGNSWSQFPIAYETVSADMEMAMPASDASSMAGSNSKVEENSFGTNNQVEGVDEADIVKSDGVHVFAAYGDLLYSWNATDGTKGTSVTQMPYNKTNCTNVPEEFHYDYNDEVDGGDSSEETSILSSSGKKNRQQRRDMSMPFFPSPCYQPKPQILSLLLHESRLTAIISESNYMTGPYASDSIPSLLSQQSSLTVRVYDVSTVPSDGSPLTLVGERKLKGNYNAARSIENTGVVVATTYVDTSSMANALYRSQPLYCGLNTTEYVNKASKIALNRSSVFAEQLIKELDLNYGCDQIFRISAMQSGNTSDTTNGDLLSQFVSVISFDTSADYLDEEIPIALSGTFSSGWINSVYASRDFVAALAVGSSYNQNTKNWDQSTFILGFDISKSTPTPYSFGQVSGSPINQYAADLYDDHFRIATTEWQWSETNGSRTTNKIYVLELPSNTTNGSSMKIVGKTDHLGKPNESIYAVRFMGDKGYIVTFEQKDPFIVVELSDPTNPRPIGELEIPGYSSYLHPIVIDGTTLLLGVGQDANETTGWTTGVKISLFNVTDPSNPVETVSFVDKGAYSNAQYDFHSFRYLPLNQKLILPQSEYTWGSDGNFDGFIVYDISIDEVKPSYNISHASSVDIYGGCWYNAYMAPRSLVFKSKVMTILSHTVLSTDLDDGTLEWELNLDGDNNTKDECWGYFREF